jgi:predicted metal-dependent phosphoesterase TrpH
MIDLHTHTNKSDGTDSPRELVNKAIVQGLTVLGITDHDTTSSWQEATESLRGNLTLALGSEISCLTEDGISVHMLGLLFDGENEQMQTMLSEARDTRIPRMRKMIELLQADGYSITMEDVIKAKPEGATLGRPHLADALVMNAIVKSRDEAFENLLHNESKYYVTHATPTPEVAIQTIKAAGGVSIIAHPMASRRGDVISTATFSNLVSAGLNGIEVDHRDQTAAERIELRKVAVDLDLVVTGASDYHGLGKLNSLGENLTDPAQWERLESLASHRRVVTP